jgi:hypothetical protein
VNKICHCGTRKEKVVRFAGDVWECPKCEGIERFREYIRTGSPFKKADNGKAPLHHLGDYHIGLEAMCRVAEYGAQKYGRNNWALCDDISRYEAAAMRHALAALAGEAADPDHGQSHWAAVAWNAMCIMHLKSKGGVDA